MIDKTAREAQAIRDARKDFAEALTALGLMAPFFERPPRRSTSSSRRRSPATSTACRAKAAQPERDGRLPEDQFHFEVHHD